MLPTNNAYILAWLEAVRLANEAARRADALRAVAEQAPLPAALRPATAADVVEGAILWFPECRKWKQVLEVVRPADPWSGYVAHDGCMYGLDGAFVETGEP